MNKNSNPIEASLRWPRALCLGLGIFDTALGAIAAALPATYAHLFHPHLADPQTDLVVRTGLLWLFFAGAEFMGFFVKRPAKWFFLVGMLRLMDVPADLAYGTLAEGASWLSRLAILTAPLFNLGTGLYLYRASKKAGRP